MKKLFLILFVLLLFSCPRERAPIVVAPAETVEVVKFPAALGDSISYKGEVGYVWGVDDDWVDFVIDRETEEVEFRWKWREEAYVLERMYGQGIVYRVYEGETPVVLK